MEEVFPFKLCTRPAVVADGECCLALQSRTHPRHHGSFPNSQGFLRSSVQSYPGLGLCSNSGKLAWAQIFLLFVDHFFQVSCACFSSPLPSVLVFRALVLCPRLWCHALPFEELMHAWLHWRPKSVLLQVPPQHQGCTWCPFSQRLYWDVL